MFKLGSKGSNGLRLALGTATALGISSVLTQLTLMREMLAAFSGNEMVLGVLLGNWLLSTGIGAALGKRASRLEEPARVMSLGLMLLALLPMVDVILLRTLRDVVFIRGAALGLGETIWGSLCLLLPYCLLSGFLLTMACSMRVGEENPAQVGKIYLADNVGSVAGGLLFTFLLVHALKPFGILYLQSILCLLVAAWLAWCTGRSSLTVLASCLILGGVALARWGDLDHTTTQIQYAGQKIVATEESPYGRLVLTELDGEYTALQNGIPFFSTHNLEQVEESVHYTMIQRLNAKKVLMIGGSASGILREIMKYDPSSVRCVELDPILMNLAKRYFPERLSDSRIHFTYGDGRRFIQETQECFDVVLMGLPEPSTCQLNRYYTREFFLEVKHALAGSGVLAFSMGTYENHLDPELAAMLAMVHRTLRSVFQEILILPGGRIYVLASDGPLSADIGARLKARSIETKLLDESWLKEMLKPDRLAEMQRAVSTIGSENRDSSPRLYYLHLRYWMSRFPAKLGLLSGLGLLALGFYLIRLRPVSFVLFSAGFAATALEVTLLLGFQVAFGSVYQQLGLIVTLFMAGLALGSWAIVSAHPLAKKACLACLWGGGQAVSPEQMPEKKHLARLAFGITAFAILLPGALRGLLAAGLSSWLGQGAFALLAIVLATLVGMQFPLAARVSSSDPSSTAARLFTADYVGACLGALLVSTLLIPLLGVSVVCFLTAGLNLLAGIVLRFSRQA